MINLDDLNDSDVNADCLKNQEDLIKIIDTYSELYPDPDNTWSPAHFLKRICEQWAIEKVIFRCSQSCPFEYPETVISEMITDYQLKRDEVKDSVSENKKFMLAVYNYGLEALETLRRKIFYEH